MQMYVKVKSSAEKKAKMRNFNTFILFEDILFSYCLCHDIHLNHEHDNNIILIYICLS